MQMWQWVVVAAVAAVSLGGMSRAILRLWSARATSEFALCRRATELESALVGADGQSGPDTVAYDVFSYRVAARFAGKCRIVVNGDAVSVSGPRVPLRLYQAWIWAQGILLALVPVFVVWALVSLEWTFLMWGLGAALLSWTVSCLGAGIWPGLGEMEFVSHGSYLALEFPLSAVSDVSIGAGWSRGGMEIVLLPYKKAIDQMAAEGAVSFFAPDERGREVRYALHCPDPQDARALARRLTQGVIEAVSA